MIPHRLLSEILPLLTLGSLQRELSRVDIDLIRRDDAYNLRVSRRRPGSARQQAEGHYNNESFA
jgi:hypothetical protein